MSNNRRAQTPKAKRGKKTSPYKTEKSFKGIGSPRNPKHKGNWDD